MYLSPLSPTLELPKRREILATIINRYDSAAAIYGLDGFWSIPREAATAIFDRWWVAGNIAPRYSYWRYITQQDWGNAAYELRHWAENGELNDPQGVLTNKRTD